MLLTLQCKLVGVWITSILRITLLHVVLEYFYSKAGCWTKRVGTFFWSKIFSKSIGSDEKWTVKWWRLYSMYYPCLTSCIKFCWHLKRKKNVDLILFCVLKIWKVKIYNFTERLLKVSKIYFDQVRLLKFSMSLFVINASNLFTN